MNAGIQDACNLGWKRAAVLNRRGTDALPRSYARERRAVDRDVVASGEDAYAWMTDTTGETLAGLYAFPRTPDGRAIAAIAETEIDTCYPQGTLIRDLRSDDTGQKVGARIGDVTGLVDADGMTTLHSLLAHPDPTVLYLAGDAPDAPRRAISRGRPRARTATSACAAPRRRPRPSQRTSMQCSTGPTHGQAEPSRGGREPMSPCFAANAICVVGSSDRRAIAERRAAAPSRQKPVIGMGSGVRARCDAAPSGGRQQYLPLRSSCR